MASQRTPDTPNRVEHGKPPLVAGLAFRNVPHGVSRQYPRHVS